MDLERIKQNFRIRSGRDRKLKKAPKPSAQNSQQPPKSAEHLQEQQSTRAAETEAKRSSALQKEKSQSVPERADSAIGVSADGSPTGDAADDRHVKPTTEELTEDKKMGNAEDPSNASEEHKEDAAEEGNIEQDERKHTAPYDADANESSEALDFDLKPPTAKPKSLSVDQLSEYLFSAGHLNTLLHNPDLLARFTIFLKRYRPNDHPYLMRYIEASKALAAIEYANAVAEGIPGIPDESHKPTSAATIDDVFHTACSTAFKRLHETTLPMYITYNLVKTVSECLTNEMAGRSTSIMSSYVGGLSEIFCLTDPNQEDNPIIYASEEFYRLTGYGRDDVINHNCRFLQGSKTKPDSAARLRAGVEKGEETYETLLNYRRDGRPFINMLMIAPLHDNQGKLKYYIGAQVDVSGLIQGGRVLEGFQKYLSKRQTDQKRAEREAARNEGNEEARRKANSLSKLRQLSELFDLEESTVVQSNSRSSSRDRDEDTRSIGSSKPKTQRKMLMDSDMSSDEEEEEKEPTKAWTLGREGPKGLSGKLPGVYEKYMLIRPVPSLRIIFTSPRLRNFGNVTQSPFLAHVAAPKATLAGLRESFASGIPVSAKVNFMPERGIKRDGTILDSKSKSEDSKHGKACWISATPLLGGDDRIGVWMIVFVEKSQAQRVPNNKPELYEGSQQLVNKAQHKPKQVETSDNQPDLRQNPRKPDQPIKPKRVGANQQDTTMPYRHVAAPPVEEYRSDEEGYQNPASEDGTEEVDRPQTPMAEGSSEGYVQTQSRHSTMSNRVRIDPDSDAEHDRPYNAAAMVTPQKPVDRAHSVSPEYLPADEPPSEPSEINSPSSPSNSGGSQTPSKPAIEKGSNMGSSTTMRQTSQSKSPDPFVEDDENDHQKEPTGPQSSGVGYMDYLRHPGSSQHKSGYSESRGRTGWRKRLSEGSSTDPDCARSPYSID